MKKIKIKLILFLTAFSIVGITNTNSIGNVVNAKTIVKYTHPHQKQIKKINSDNKKLEAEIKKAKQENTKLIKAVNANKKQLHQSSVSHSAKSNDLTKLTYAGKQEVVVNGNKPSFKKDDLSTKKGFWEAYSDLDQLNRPVAANAMLNVNLMPTEKRESLTANPTGWHNKRIKSGWLYNRSHLIGYQLTGQNNNPRNLITGTRSLNSPEMLAHEMDIAYYLKQNKKHYVRYRVTPIFKGKELLARGVQMEAQSIGDNAISFNVFIFNVQDGVKLNYGDGTSVVQ